MNQNLTPTIEAQLLRKVITKVKMKYYVKVKFSKSKIDKLNYQNFTVDAQMEAFTKSAISVI